MSYGTISEEKAVDAREMPGVAKLCANLSDAMHAMSQPLTVLQVRLDSQLTKNMGAEDLRGLVRESALEIERLCNLFGYLQGFVMAECMEPDLSTHELAPMLEHVAEGMKLFFGKEGIILRVQASRSGESIVGDRTRMYQALSRVLLVAYEVSTRNDTVDLIGSGASNGARVVIRNSAALGNLSKEAGLKMALAEVNIRHQGGCLTWTEAPFCALIELQGAAGVAAAQSMH